MSDKKNSIKKIWGLALVLMGIALVFRVPEILDRLKDNPVFVSGRIYLSFSFYFVSLVLIVGGIKKMMSSKNGNDEN